MSYLYFILIGLLVLFLLGLIVAPLIVLICILLHMGMLKEALLKRFISLDI